MSMNRLQGIAFLGLGQCLAASGTAAVATLGYTLPPEMHSSSTVRGGPIVVIDGGNEKTGYFNVSTSGVLTIGSGVNSSGSLVNFTAGATVTGIPEQVITYSLA